MGPSRVESQRQRAASDADAGAGAGWVATFILLTGVKGQNMCQADKSLGLCTMLTCSPALCAGSTGSGSGSRTSL